MRIEMGSVSLWVLSHPKGREYRQKKRCFVSLCDVHELCSDTAYTRQSKYK